LDNVANEKNIKKAIYLLAIVMLIIQIGLYFFSDIKSSLNLLSILSCLLVITKGKIDIKSKKENKRNNYLWAVAFVCMLLNIATYSFGFGIGFIKAIM